MASLMRVLMIFMYLIASCFCCQIENFVTLDCTEISWAKVKSYLSIYKDNYLITKISIRSIEIEGNINSLPFKDFENLDTLYLHENNLNDQHFTADVFKGLEKIRHLHISKNNLENIPGNLSKNLPNLLTLNLERNYISQIKDGDFYGLQNLSNLYLNGNRIRNVDKNGFATVKNSLAILDLSNNELSYLPASIKELKNLKYLDISQNPIKKIHNGAFSGMVSLSELILFRRDVQMGGMNIEEKAFNNMPSLKVLNLNQENIFLKSFPDLQDTDQLRVLKIRGIKNLEMPKSFCEQKLNLIKISISHSTMAVFPSLSKCAQLRKINFQKNTVGYIPSDAFSGLKHIEILDLLEAENFISLHIHKDAFSNLPSLKQLDLSHYRLNVFPNITGNKNLRFLLLPGCNIKTLPRDFCNDLPKLKTLDLSDNSLMEMPDLSACKRLESVYLRKNNIQIINNELFKLEKLKYLIMTENRLVEIGKRALSTVKSLEELHLNHNLISDIHEKAFENIENLKVLDLSFNNIHYLPSSGLTSLNTIKVVGNKELINFPTRTELPYATELDLVYPYHCCFFMKKIQQIRNDIEINFLSSQQSNWTAMPDSSIIDIIRRKLRDPKHDLTDSDDFIEPFLREMNNNDSSLFVEKRMNRPPQAQATQTNLLKVRCTPTPNEFYPCEDLMGKEWLRICVWVVFLSAFFGNIVVFIVIAMNLGRKADVQKYLVMNLAFADLCLAIYLGFLSFVDLLTLGDFRLHALKWQFSSSCQIAGFFAVFSSELSVYTLTVITVERFTTIKYSMHIDKLITKRQAIAILIFGWMFAGIVALLPIVDIGGVSFSSYSKYSVCLPFDVDSVLSKVYVSVLLVLNLTAFVIICICYIKIYFSVFRTNSWNSGDSKVARKMAILVFTDFACWFPISIIALSAVHGNSFVKDLWISKVITIFVFPLNACANPFLYAIFTKTFRKDVGRVVTRVRRNSSRSRDLSKSLLKLPIKSSSTYSTSVRRESTCSFLVGRRTSSRPDDIKSQTKSFLPFGQQPYEEEEKQVNIVAEIESSVDEKVTSL